MNILNFQEIDSTNKYLIKHKEELDNLTFVFTNFQTEGKGRENRNWYSNKDQNLLFSFLIKNRKNTSKFPMFSICTAAVILKILQNYSIKNVSIKWPNDVYVNDKKICGILLQGSLPDYCVVGVGLNVNQTDFPSECRVAPTSLKNELNVDVNIDKLKKEIVNEICSMYGKPEPYFLLAKANDYLKGKQILVDGEKVEYLGFNDDCELVCVQNKILKNIRSGEVCIVKQ